MGMKKGFFFTLDAILGASILIICILLISSFHTSQTSSTNINYKSYDLVRILSTLKIGEVDNAYVKELIASGQIKRLNNTVLEQIGEFWAEGSPDLATGIAKNVTEQLVPEMYGYGFWINSEEIYKNEKTTMSSLVSSKSIISGIAKDKPVEGYSSRVYLSGINSRTISSYAFFGGFVGNGILSQKIILPSNYSQLLECYMEFAAKSNFTLYINGNYSGNYSIQQTSDMRANKWYVNESYLDGFKTGNNTIMVNFTTTNMSSEYISGGYIRVKTRSSDVDFSEVEYIDEDTAKKREYLPGIEGVINLYSSFYVPGILSSMKIHLHYVNDYMTYMTIGNETVYHTDKGTYDVLLEDIDLIPPLDYNEISKKTVPIRIGTGNVSVIEGAGNGNADVVLITDLSGSMNWTLDADVAGIARQCDNADLTNQSTKRLSLAKCLDKEFIDIILNTTGNRIAVVGFYADESNPFKGRTRAASLTTNRTLLNNEVNNYTIEGGTCICCGINRAYNILNAQSGSSRKKYVIVMSDGIPTHQCGSMGGDQCKGTRDGSPSNEGLWLGFGAGCYGGTDDCDTVDCDCAMKNANWSSCRARNNLNATVHSIGFGPVASCISANWTLRSVAGCGSGNYYASSNASELQNIYRAIASSIVSISYSGQLVVVSGTFNSTLYNDSYIEFEYDPISYLRYGETPFEFESDPFGNNISQGTLFIPGNVSVLDVKVTSYSGNKWTDNLTLQNSAATGVYSLMEYSNSYAPLGDPFLVNIPSDIIEEGNNIVTVSTGYSPNNNSGGSYDNRILYTLSLSTIASYSDVGEYARGCNWTIFFQDGSNMTLPSPSNYNGIAICDYKNRIYNENDAINKAAFSLLSSLDIDKDGILDAQIDPDSLSVWSLVIPGVPTLWGPLIIEVRVWE